MQRHERTAAHLLPLAVVLGVAAPAAGIEWVTIGDPDNPPDVVEVVCCDEGRGQPGEEIGAVGYVYRISRTEVTNVDYTTFLNAVASSGATTAEADPNGLYNTRRMANQIKRTALLGGFVYEVVPGFEHYPTPNIDFYDGARFANWLHNGEPTGAQDATTTEDGAYTLLGTNPPDVERHPDAAFFVPSEDEWYKAAYYDPDLGGYWDYPNASDAIPTAEYPPGGENSANYKSGPFLGACNPTINPCDRTEAGAYVASQSPWGTFDQGGNLFEWLEETRLGQGLGSVPPGVTARLIRGGFYERPFVYLGIDHREVAEPDCQNCAPIGLRIAAPEPSSPLLVAAALALAAALAHQGRRR